MITTTKSVNLRLAAQRRGFLLIKRRDKKYAPGLGDGYMILDSYSGNIVAGHRYELSPEDVRDLNIQNENQKERENYADY